MKNTANEWREEVDSWTFDYARTGGLYLPPSTIVTNTKGFLKDFIQNLLEDKAVIKGERRRIIEQIREEERARIVERISEMKTEPKIDGDVFLKIRNKTIDDILQARGIKR